MTNAPEHAEGPAATASLVGQSVGKYELLRLVGRGGMGTVYEALNTTIKKRVAMKCIDASLARNEEANARFQREALAAGAIESPHIVQIFDAGVTPEGTPYIVMELLRGEDLGRHLADRGRLQLADALNVVVQVLRGLHRAHAAGIIHRDLKPDNVFLCERDDEPHAVKILDFGVSKINRSQDVPLETLTQQGSVVGTPFYMSPEQAQAFPDVDARADLYSVGAILYECLSGRPPHVGQSYEQVIVNICMKDAADIRSHNASVPAPIAAILARALSRDRKLRYGSAREMLDAIVAELPAELRSRYRSGASGMRRVPLGTAESAAADAGAGAAGDEPAGGDPVERAARAGAPHPGGGGLADAVRADSGMMSVAAPPSDPPLVPFESGRRLWTVGGVVLAIVGLGAAAFVWTSLGEPTGESAAAGASRAASATASGASSAAPAAAWASSTAGRGGGAAGTDPGATGAGGSAAVARPGDPAAGVPVPPATAGTGGKVWRPAPPATSVRVQPRPPSTAPGLPPVSSGDPPPSGLPLLTE